MRLAGRCARSGAFARLGRLDLARLRAFARCRVHARPGRRARNLRSYNGRGPRLRCAAVAGRRRLARLEGLRSLAGFEDLAARPRRRRAGRRPSRDGAAARSVAGPVDPAGGAREEDGRGDDAKVACHRMLLEAGLVVVAATND